MAMKKMASDSWLARRMMRLTHGERRFVNDPANAERVAHIAGSLLNRVTLPPEPQCLEIGCGQGAGTRLLVERYGAWVVATDYDPAQLALAEERLADLEERVGFRVVDARTMPFDNEQFDGVVAFQVMHHIPAGWRQVVAEAARVLRPAGWFIFTDMVLPPRAGRVIRRLLHRLDPLEEMALHACLAQNGLHLEHYERGQRMLLGLMGHCEAVAHKI